MLASEIVKKIHTRRNFYEARERAPQRCRWILRQIAHLYRIEEKLRRRQAGPRKRAAVRSSQSRCRGRGIDPYVYLRDVLTKLPSLTNWQVKDITPEAWAKTSRSSNSHRGVVPTISVIGRVADVYSPTSKLCQ